SAGDPFGVSAIFGENPAIDGDIASRLNRQRRWPRGIERPGVSTENRKTHKAGRLPASAEASAARLAHTVAPDAGGSSYGVPPVPTWRVGRRRQRTRRYVFL